MLTGVHPSDTQAASRRSGRVSLLTTGRDEPLHVALAHYLRARIEAEEWRAGARLPAVRQLAAEFGVSAVTAARGLQLLAADGLVMSVHGKGTFVAERGTAGAEDLPAHDFSWQHVLLPTIAPTRAAAILASDDTPADVISLASSASAADAFPKTFRAAWQVLARSFPASVAQGRSPAGDPELRAWIARYVERTGIQTDLSRILVTGGAQQAINLTAQVLLRPGDTVLVERPTYIFALSVFESLGATCIEVPVDEHGLRVDLAEDLLARFRPKLIFTVPTGHQPTGATMPLARRHALLAAARRFDAIILEDDFAHEFSYGGAAPCAIKSLDWDGHVVYARSFSKITVPALRVGCIVADGPLLHALLEAKRLADRYTSSVLQQALLAYASGRYFLRDLERARGLYKVRRAAMQAALEREMPVGVTWSMPAAGFNVWLTLPPSVSASAVASEAARRGVLVARGEPFFYRGDPDNALRLTFSDNDPLRIREGVRRLGPAIEAVMATSRRTATSLPVADVVA